MVLPSMAPTFSLHILSPWAVFPVFRSVVQGEGGAQ
jgi:hypothetical protein